MSKFLDVDFEIDSNELFQDYQIICPNGNKLVISDSFFKNCEESYLRKEYFPQEIKMYDLNFGKELHTYPVVFGEKGVKIKESEIVVNTDFIGSSFFTLTRLEEVLSDDFDKHGRFKLMASLSYKFDYYHLPIVDIYCELIRLFLIHLDPSIDIQKQERKVIPSHDIDYYEKWGSFKNYLGAIKRTLFKSGSFNDFLTYSRSYFSKENPFDTIDYFNGMAKKNDVHAKYYFLIGGNSKHDNSNFELNRENALEFIHKVDKSGYEIGIHPSYESYMDVEKIKEEKQKLESILERNVTLSRQHYLRISIPETLRNLDQLGIKEDASLGFSEKPGFRCGTSKSYPFFDVKNKEELKIHILPLVFMDTSILNDNKTSFEEHLKYANELKAKIVRYGGNWHFLIHNTNFFWQDEKEYFKFWESLYN